MSASIESRIYGLFATGDPELTANIPDKVIEECGDGSDERVIAIPSLYTQHFIDGIKDCSVSTNGFEMFYPVTNISRRINEHFGDHIQVIGAACIHTDTEILMLEVQNDCKHSIDGYHPGTLTYPQGHCRGGKYADRESFRVSYAEIFQIIKSGIYRELEEEIGAKTYKELKAFQKIARDDLKRAHSFWDTCVIYINKPGTTQRHICVLVQIDLTRAKCPELIHSLIANEPEKHSIKVMTYESLLELDSIEDICPWVAASFAANNLKFMHTSFIADYLHKKENSCDE